MRTVAPSCLLLVLITVPPAQSDGDLLAKYNDDLKAQPHSSITHLRLAEIYFQRGNFQEPSISLRSYAPQSRFTGHPLLIPQGH
jgi:hypothetical protein